MENKSLFVAICLITACCATGFLPRKRSHAEKRTSELNIQYKTLYLEQPVDHFGFANEDTYQMRYLVNDDHWDSNGGPIFFYCGNEGDIELFSNNTGAMWEWAPQFKAMVVFAEHRYYGKSMPYGEDSYKDIEHLGYLSSEQALADFASLISVIRRSMKGADKSAVIAFGGSYGGMLATWIRMKYPDAVQGSLAASAPIWMFPGLNPCNNFYKVVTADFVKGGPHCADNIKASWAVLDNGAQTADGRKKITDAFKLCSPLQTVDDVGSLKGWLYNTYGNLAMIDYPYPANFLEPLPAWPVKEVCKHLNIASPSEEDLLTHLSAAISVYYNYTGNNKCLNLSEGATSDLGDVGWDFQACSEMVMPMCTDGKTDMFEPDPWDYYSFAANCKKRWNVVTRPDWAKVVYGGKDIKDVTNIIFSNGGLDPWSAGGVLTDLSPSLVSIFIPEGAHHLDLRASHPDDPASVTSAREKEKSVISKWIDEHRAEGYQDSNANSFHYVYLRPMFHQSWSLHGHNSALPSFLFITLLMSAGVLLAMIVIRRKRSEYRYVNALRHQVNQAGVGGFSVAQAEKAPLL